MSNALFLPSCALWIRISALTRAAWIEICRGPNAPLYASCAPVDECTGVVDDYGGAAAVKWWVGAGFPREKIVLGVPAYG